MSSSTPYPPVDKTLLLSNVVRSFQLGLVTVTLLITLSILIFKKRIIYNYLAVCSNLTALIFYAISIAWDTEVLPNCLLRVKLIYVLVAIMNLNYEFAQVHKCISLYQGRIRHAKYLFPAVLLLRVIPHILSVANWTFAVLPSQRCASVLPAVYLSIDRTCQIIFDVIMGVSFAYPLYQSSMKFTASFQRYKELIFNEAFVLIFSLIANIIYISLVLSANLSINIGLLNAACSSFPAVFNTLFVVVIAFKQGEGQKSQHSLPVNATGTGTGSGRTNAFNKDTSIKVSSFSMLPKAQSSNQV
ncbi:hypothetical protein BKA69DRAFT_496468 [Paraphysoderma sedebokerense]|nr:hypothetical protein BKA69DRAFT_496468 [Paraphysoderma sedebokerense]